MARATFSGFDPELNDKQTQLIAQGALTNSKRPECFLKGLYPTHMKEAHGAYTWDTHGNRYIDFICALGTNLLGYSNVEIQSAVTHQLSKGILFSVASSLESDCAERLAGIFPFIEQVRFLKTGSDACTAAVRIARAYHGVNEANEELYKVYGNKEFTRIQPGLVETGWLSKILQTVCEKISVIAKSHGNKAQSPSQVLENHTGSSSGVTAQPKEMEPSKELGSGQDLLSSQASTRETELQSMWISELTGTSRRLLEASRSDLAVPGSSHGTPPRVLVLSDGYHGFHDTFVGLTNPHAGVIKDPYTLPLKGNEDLIPIAAAVIIEPVTTDYSENRKQYLQNLRDQCSKHGTTLIFDEVITGFRTPKYSVSNHWGITPDLICLGKAIANGMPLSVVGGKRDIMSGSDYFVSSTYAGDTLSLAAAIRVMHLLHTKFNVEYLWEQGGKFLMRFNSIYPEKLKIEGYPTRGVFTGDELTKAIFWQEAVKAGMLFGPSFFFNFTHIELADQVIINCRDILTRIKTGQVKLNYDMPQTPFAQKVRAS